MKIIQTHSEINHLTGRGTHIIPWYDRTIRPASTSHHSPHRPIQPIAATNWWCIFASQTVTSSAVVGWFSVREVQPVQDVQSQIELPSIIASAPWGYWILSFVFGLWMTLCSGFSVSNGCFSQLSPLLVRQRGGV